MLPILCVWVFFLFSDRDGFVDVTCTLSWKIKAYVRISNSGYLHLITITLGASLNWKNVSGIDILINQAIGTSKKKLMLV